MLNEQVIRLKEEGRRMSLRQLLPRALTQRQLGDVGFEEEEEERLRKSHR
jgi:hypothetical protein